MNNARSKFDILNKIRYTSQENIKYIINIVHSVHNLFLSNNLSSYVNYNCKIYLQLFRYFFIYRDFTCRISVCEEL